MIRNDPPKIALAQFCDDPQKYPYNLHTPNLLKPPKTIEIQNVKLPKWAKPTASLRIWKYQSTTPPPTTLWVGAGHLPYLSIRSNCFALFEKSIIDSFFSGVGHSIIKALCINIIFLLFPQTSCADPGIFVRRGRGPGRGVLSFFSSYVGSGPASTAASNLYGTHMGSATGFHMGPIWAGPCK